MFDKTLIEIVAWNCMKIEVVAVDVCWCLSRVVKKSGLNLYRRIR